MQKLRNINFFRIFFTLMIVYGHLIQHHMMPLYGDLPFFEHMSHHLSYSFGYMCDMFFIISGFFMFFSFKKTQNFLNFVYKKIVRLLPVLVFAILSFGLLSLVIKDVNYYKYGNFLALFFLDDAFIANFSTNIGVAWYINVMFWGYIFYYCVINLFPKDKVNYAVGIIIFFAYSILLNKEGLYEQPQIWAGGLLTICMLRSIAGMGLGYIIGSWFDTRDNESANSSNDNVLTTCFYTLLECTALIYIFKFAIRKALYYNFALMTVIFVIVFLLFLTKKGYISRITDNDVIFNLGKYGFSIYVMQGVVFAILRASLFKNASFISQHPVLILIYSVSIICLVGIATYYLVELPSQKLLKNIKQNCEAESRSMSEITRLGGGQTRS